MTEISREAAEIVVGGRTAKHRAGAELVYPCDPNSHRAAPSGIHLVGGEKLLFPEIGDRLVQIRRFFPKMLVLSVLSQQAAVRALPRLDARQLIIDSHQGCADRLIVPVRREQLSESDVGAGSDVKASIQVGQTFLQIPIHLVAEHELADGASSCLDIGKGGIQSPQLFDELLQVERLEQFRTALIL